MLNNATVDICQDIRFEQGGLISIIGVYSRDISIYSGAYPIKRMFFLFHMEGDSGDVPVEIIAEVTLPKLEPRQHVIEVPDVYRNPESGKWILRAVVGFENEMIYAGEIKARVVFGEVVRDVGAGRIVLNDQAGVPAPT